jgi:SAM-dependent methyltransferase
MGTRDSSVPELDDRLMVPLIFEPYADELVGRLRGINAVNVLEVAAGSGVVTRAMVAGLTKSAAITATDLNQPMLDHAQSVSTAAPVTWQQADVMALPFPDASFDAVVCQFGVMFFPDQAAAHAEVARVLRPGGTYLFSVWDRTEANEFVHEVEQALAALYPDSPPTFMSRTPHGYFDEATIRADVAATSAFESVTIDSVEALAARFGAVDPVGKIRGFVITATAEG